MTNVVVVANREPYANERDADGAVVIKRAPSGLVTGIEPLLRACGGTWIAYGSGSADEEGYVAVPPDAPEYTLRRVRIDPKTYERFYCGCSNEALWPLCHIAYNKPVFRAADWEAYQAVNELFAGIAAEEAQDGAALLIQDYHFALVPRVVRNTAPHVVTSLFWHIPWPSPDLFAICPWKEALLDGLTGADVVGFHTRQYCLNFLESLRRNVECRVDVDAMTVTARGHRTLVRAYPISVEWPYPAATRRTGAALRDSLGIPAGVHVSLGVDRADYTKGLLERVAAIELLLEQTPSLAGQFVFVQLASPTRLAVPKYRQLADELNEAVGRVNARFGTAEWTPILLRMRAFSFDEVREHYAMADSAVVTPLHDGMNLVAKEYAAACEDGDGALVLSIFAGAAKELDGALLVNPYDMQETADAILRAIRMPAAERRARMQSMRSRIAAHSIRDWSRELLSDLEEVRAARSRYWPQKPSRDEALQEVAAG